MNRSKRIFLSPPHMEGEELAAVSRVFEANWIAPVGPDINAFEKEICEYCGAVDAVALSSGTAGIHLALQLCGVKAGDEVLCSSFTFAGSAFPICYCGAVPVFIDSETDSWNIDPQLLEEAIEERLSKGKKTAALIVVHLYGQSARMDSIAEVCNKYNIPIIEDAAEAVGTFYKEKHVGTIGRFGVFSFNGNKIITTSGGGILVGNNGEDIKKARFLSTQARENYPYYQHEVVGYNYRMSNVLAAIGREQLKILEMHVQRKKEIFNLYRNGFSGYKEIRMMPIAPWGRANYWLTCITINSDDEYDSPEVLRIKLEEENIESRPLWKPMHLQPVFSRCRSFNNDVSDSLFKNGLCLPSGSALTDDDVERIINIVTGHFRRK